MNRVAVAAACAAALAGPLESEALDTSRRALFAAASPGIGPGLEVARTVTGSAAGVLAGVRLPLTCDPGLLQVEVRGLADGLPDEHVLASEAVTVPGTRTPRVFTVPLTGRPVVREGQPFALLLTASGTCAIRRGDPTDGSPPGEVLFRWPGLETWVSLGGGELLPVQPLVERRGEAIIVDVDLDGKERDEEGKDARGGHVAARCFLQGLRR